MTEEEPDDFHLVFDANLLRAGAGQLARRPDRWYRGEARILTVICPDPTQQHPDKVVKLLTFRGFWSGREDEEIGWSAAKNRSRSSKPGRNQASHDNDDWWQRTLEDPGFLPNPSKHGEGNEFGIKTVFTCGLCGDNFQASDRARLHAVLTKLWENDVTEIPLTLLRAAYTREQLGGST